VRFPAAPVIVLLLTSSEAAIELSVDLRAIEQALFIGRSTERERTRFHATYRLAVDQAPVDHIDLVTPFRRIVLATEQSAGRGAGFGQRQAIELIAAAPEQVELRVELTFHPLNTLVGVPGYDVAITPATGPPIRPKSLDRVPRFGARVDGMPPPYPGQPGAGIPRGAGPMLGGAVVASFDGRLLVAGGVYDVVLSEMGKELARARLPLGSIR
jgi:hypothetical protein